MKEVWDSFKEECGVIGVWNHEEASKLAYLGLFAQQHRGQEAAGINSLAQGIHYTHKGLGLVGDVFSAQDFSKLPGEAAIGHVRYSTTGSNQIINTQPLGANLLSGPVAIAHNGNIVNADLLKKELQQTGSIFQGTNDSEVVLHLLSKHPSGDLLQCLKDLLPRLKGAYSLVIMTHEGLYAVRDPWGFRPLVVGKKISSQNRISYVVASETCAFDLIEADFQFEVKPGEIVRFTKDKVEKFRFADENHKQAKCVFEHVYFSRPDSVVFGHSVYESRKKFGQWLAKETFVDADIVVPVPDSGVPAALGFSLESKIPFELGIIRNHYVGRTFIEPQQSLRDFGVKIKLNPQNAVLKDKKVIVIDDSLVRGTTSKKIIRLIRNSGAKEVHMRIASPPTIGPCYYGVDTPQKDQLIAANQSLEEIRNFIGADSLAYLSIEGLMGALDDSPQPQKKTFCSACFDGKYPSI
jgi:amidophosphoribosyltransferase